MAIKAIHVDQRVIDIDSRRFASVEKALVELITNSDDSYARLERAGAQVTGRMRVQYERHQGGALLVVAGQAEGMSFDRASRILTYGGAHSALARGEGGGRGYFGRDSSRPSLASATAGSRPFMPDNSRASTCSGAKTAATCMKMGEAIVLRWRRITSGWRLPAAVRRSPSWSKTRG